MTGYLVALAIAVAFTLAAFHSGEREIDALERELSELTERERSPAPPAHDQLYDMLWQPYRAGFEEARQYREDADIAEVEIRQAFNLFYGFYASWLQHGE